jgi:polyisoprenoid-binding protein YceI
MTSRVRFNCRPFFFSAVLLAAAAPALAQTAAQLVPKESEIRFTTRQMGVPVEGRFGRFSVQIALDPKSPAAGSVRFEIDTASAGFGAPELDGEVPKATWLAAARFPKATFKSTAIQAAGAGRFQVSGKLDIKGASRDIVVPVQLAQTGSGPSLVSTASGSFTIQRLDFKIGEAEWADTSLLANDVLVQFKLKLTGLAPL